MREIVSLYTMFNWVRAGGMEKLLFIYNIFVRTNMFKITFYMYMFRVYYFKIS